MIFFDPEPKKVRMKKIFIVLALVALTSGRPNGIVCQKILRLFLNFFKF